MSSLFSGINVALRAMLAHQHSIEVIEHNVSNANTPGYHRQETVLTAGIPTTLSSFYNVLTGGQIGTGVVVEKVKRYSYNYFDVRYRNELSDSCRWNLESEVLKQVEVSLDETVGGGLQEKLNEFWNGWQSLSSDPTNTALRIDLYNRATALTDAINNTSNTLHQLQLDQNLSIQQRVEEINTIASQIAVLNGEIAHLQAVYEQPNDLMDKRDVLLDRLSELVGIKSNIQENGEVIVSINGHSLVTGQSAYSLTVSSDPLNAAINWEDGQSFTADSGEICALIDVRDSIIPLQKEGLDKLAYNLVKSVNQIHNPPGMPVPDDPPYHDAGMDFFTDISDVTNAAGLIRVNPDMEDFNNIMGASSAYPADGTIARCIANLQSTLISGLDGVTLNDFQINLTSELGLYVQNSVRYAEDRGEIADALRDQRESFIGVSMDEEAANLIKSQRAYEAAARLVTVMDEMLDTVINGMGVVGR